MRLLADAGVAHRLVEKLLHALGDPPVRLQLWNGRSVTTSTAPSLLTLRIANRSTLWRLMADPDMQFGEAYTCLLYTSPSPRD